MKERPFHIVDVFAETRYAGNQLAVITNSTGLSGDDMQAIAQEMNFSETAFLLSDTTVDDAYPVRIFTPHEELPFAGHPTLGSSFVIRDLGLVGDAEAITLSVTAGRIPVRFEASGNGPAMVWMRQLSPSFGKRVAREVVAGLLGLRVDQVDPRFEPQIVSTGVPFLIAPLVDRKAVEAAVLDHRIARSASLREVYLFCAEPVDAANNLHARMLTKALEREDPATGSACGCLAGYLVEHGYFSSDVVKKRVEQGYEVGRPSLLHIDARRHGDEIEVNVGGQVWSIARGVLTG